MFLEMLRGALEMYGGVKVVGVAGTVHGGIAACQHAAPELLIIDLSLPDGSGLAVAQRAIAIVQSLKVIVLSAQIRTFVCPDWLQHHLHAIVDKNRAFNDLRAALERLTPRAATLPDPAEVTAAARDAGDAGDAGLYGKPLSARELQVFTLIGEGLVNREIARRLELAEDTVRVHRKRIARKLGTRGNDLARRAIEHRARMLPPGRRVGE